MSEEDEYEYEKVITCLFWDLEDFPVPDNLNPSTVYQNLLTALEKKGFPGELAIRFYNGDQSEAFVELFYEGGFSFYSDATDDIYVKARKMIRDALLWSVVHRDVNNPQPPLTLVLVSNKFSSGGETSELLSFLQDLKSRNFNILLALSEEHNSGAPFPTLSFNWLWQSILADSPSVCSTCALERASPKKPRLETRE